MRNYLFQDMDGEWLEARCAQEDCALGHINKRLERVVPVETVDTDALKKAILAFNVEFERPITPEEAGVLVQALKAHILNEMSKMEKFYVSKVGKGDEEDENKRVSEHV